MTVRDPRGIVNLLDLMLAERGRLRFDGDTGEGISTTRWAFLAGLEYLANRERGGVDAARRRLASIRELLTSTELGAPLLDENASAQPLGLHAAELLANQSLLEAETALADSGQIMSPVAIKRLCDWEIADSAIATGATSSSTPPATAITAELLTSYIRRRLNDDTICVTQFSQLRGGFNKETYLFTVSGRALSGELVMRRDTSVILIPNACHRVRNEFEVLKALQETGFSSPQVLWVETLHDQIPGGDFIIMRRSRGTCGGTLFGASDPPDPALNEQLGSTVGRLHSLPPLLRLGALTESIQPHLWNLPASEVVRRYLTDFRALLLASPHAPSPATIAILNWLIANVPETPLRPCLIHGDIGFHNILLDAGQLSIIVDWERAHIGHPAEDLAYLHNAAAKDLDWERFMAAYRGAGGPEVSESDLQFFRIMMLARNAISLNIGPSRVFNGEVGYIKLLVAEYYMLPRTLESIAALIDSYPA